MEVSPDSQQGGGQINIDLGRRSPWLVGGRMENQPAGGQEGLVGQFKPLHQLIFFMEEALNN